ncbi:MAG: DUF4186 family protein [bacterium]|nr:DUF4186 family protein [bacterium]
MSPKKPKELDELKVTCESVDCENGLHCFRQAKRKAKAHGPCRACGAALVDWDRIHTRDLLDVDHTFEALRFERIRHYAWHLKFSQHAVNYARRAGYKGIEGRVRKRIRSAIGKAQPFRDGAQTPLGGKNPIYYAQHATATCCRRCLEYWHAIPQGNDLTHDQIEYAAELVVNYLRLRLPDLTDHGESVPPIRRGART